MVEVTDQPPKPAKTQRTQSRPSSTASRSAKASGPRLAESLDLALKLADGRWWPSSNCPHPALPDPGWEERFLSVHLRVPGCGTGLPKIEPRTFSFNSPHGPARPARGWGRAAFLAELSVPDRVAVVVAGRGRALAACRRAGKTTRPHETQVPEFLTRHTLTRHSAAILAGVDCQRSGTGEPAGIPRRRRDPRKANQSTRQRGETIRRGLEAYREQVACPACGGSPPR